MKNLMKSTVGDYGVYGKNTPKFNRNFIVTRMDRGLLRCLREKAHNSHVCACACVCARNHRNTVNTVTSECLCGFHDYGTKKHRNFIVNSPAFAVPESLRSLSASTTGKWLDASDDYDTVIKWIVNGSAQPAGLTAQSGSPMGAL